LVEIKYLGVPAISSTLL